MNLRPCGDWLRLWLGLLFACVFTAPIFAKPSAAETAGQVDRLLAEEVFKDDTERAPASMTRPSYGEPGSTSSATSPRLSTSPPFCSTPTRRNASELSGTFSTTHSTDRTGPATGAT